MAKPRNGRKVNFTEINVFSTCVCGNVGTIKSSKNAVVVLRISMITHKLSSKLLKPWVMDINVHNMSIFCDFIVWNNIVRFVSKQFQLFQVFSLIINTIITYFFYSIYNQWYHEVPKYSI